MKFEAWWAKQTESFDPEEIGLMQLARVTWHAAKEDARKGCAAAIAKADLECDNE